MDTIQRRLDWLEAQIQKLQIREYLSEKQEKQLAVYVAEYRELLKK